MDHDIRLAETEADIRACYSVIRQLRKHLQSEDEFLERVQRQRQAHDYNLACLIDNHGKVCSTAGFRVAENLSWGKFMYVDDMVTCDEERNKGYGGFLLEFLIGEARRRRCDNLQLDSAIHRFPAHRLYMSRGLAITSLHFSLALQDP